MRNFQCVLSIHFFVWTELQLHDPSTKISCGATVLQLFYFQFFVQPQAFFPICPLKNSGINSILPNKKVGFKANSSLVYWVYQSLSYEKTQYSLYNLSRNHSCFVSALPRLYSTSSVCLIDNHFYHLKLILIIPRL